MSMLDLKQNALSNHLPLIYLENYIDKALYSSVDYSGFRNLKKKHSKGNNAHHALKVNNSFKKNPKMTNRWK